MFKNLSLRVRVLLFFVFAAALVPLILGVALFLAAQRLEGNPVPPLVLYGGAAGVALIGTIMWVWSMFDTNVAKPIMALVRDVQTLMHANPKHEIDTQEARYLGLLAPTVKEIAHSLRKVREDVDNEVRQATASVDQQRLQLEAILRELNEGVVICNLDHQVLLYNRRALEILHVSGELGLGRSLFSIVNRRPFITTLDRLSNRLSEGRHLQHRDRLMATVVFATTQGDHILQGKVSLVVDEEGNTATGYVLTFDDVTKQLAALAKSDRMLREVVEGLRRPVANLRAATEMLADPELDAEGRKAFEGVLHSESETLSADLERLGDDYKHLVSSHWPMSDVVSANLLNCLTRRYDQNSEIKLVSTGDPVWVHCDASTTVELIDHLITRIVKKKDVSQFEVSAEEGENRTYIDISWAGTPVGAADVDAWLGEPLDRGIAGLSGREVLVHHKAELWCEQMGDGRSRLRLPLLLPIDVHEEGSTATSPLPIRLEFYDFDLLGRVEAGELGNQPLKDLTYVVFDTETTGLDPSGGDEMIQIAAVRIVNGRLLKGEIFDQLIDPGRLIPPKSTAVHHITNEMVVGKPKAEDVLPRFHEFVGDAVLIAHNAAFDMKFLELKEKSAGVRFENPVLDTVLLSAIVHDHTGAHTLDAVAERFSIEIPPEVRHTAIGDSLATAEAFLKLLDLLEVNHITTLSQATEASDKLLEIKKKQARY